MDRRLPRVLREFPDAVRFENGQALYQAELGERHPLACAMQGLNAVEIVRTIAWIPTGASTRSLFTTRLKGFIYVLHCFQKKSKAGIKTPKRDLELIRRRLAEAEQHFRAVVERKE